MSCPSENMYTFEDSVGYLFRDETDDESEKWALVCWTCDEDENIYWYCSCNMEEANTITKLIQDKGWKNQLKDLTSRKTCKHLSARSKTERSTYGKLTRVHAPRTADQRFTIYRMDSKASKPLHVVRPTIKVTDVAGTQQVKFLQQNHAYFNIVRETKAGANRLYACTCTSQTRCQHTSALTGLVRHQNNRRRSKSADPILQRRSSPAQFFSHEPIPMIQNRTLKSRTDFKRERDGYVWLTAPQPEGNCPHGNAYKI